MINTEYTTMRVEVTEKDMPQVISYMSDNGWKYIGPDSSLERKVTIVFYKKITSKL